MASNVLGEIYVKVGADTQGFNKGVDQAQTKTKGLTSGIFKAQVAFALFQKAVQLAANFLKGSVKEAAEAEKVHAQLVQTLKNSGGALGLSAKQIEATSKAYQKISIFGDEAITTAQMSLIQFRNIGKDVFPQATKAILDAGSKMGDLGSAAQIVGRALERPSLGMRQLRSINIIFTAEQQKAITKMEKMGNVAGAQKIILDKLNATYGGMTETMRNTWGGAVAAMQNSFSDLQENFGKILIGVGKPFVEMLTKIIDKVNEFLESDEGFEIILTVVKSIAAVFSVLWDVLKELGKGIFEAIGKAIQPIIEAFKKLNPEGDKANIILLIISAVIKQLTLVLGIIGRVIGTVIELVIDLVTAFEKAANVMRRFFEFLANPSKETAKVFKEATEESAKAWETLAKNVVKNIEIIGTEIVDGFKKLPLETKKMADDMAKNVTYTVTTLEEGMRKARTTIDEGLGGTKPPAKKLPLIEAAKTFKERWAAAFKETQDGFKSTMQIIKEEADKYNAISDQLMGSLSSIISQASTNATTAAENDYNTRKKYIEDNVTDEASRTAQLEALDEEYAATQKQLQLDAFYANKAVGVVNSLIATAMAVVNALATPGVPFPVAIAFAAAAGIMGAIQTALIAAQPPPALAEGGLVLPRAGGTNVIMAEAGAPEFAVPDKSSIWNMIADRISSNMGNTNNYNTVNNNLPGNLTLQVGENQLAATLTNMSQRGKFFIDPNRGIARR